MGAHKPRSGSLAFYPRKRAKRELATFRTFAKTEEKTTKPLNFVGYKVGMVQCLGKNEHQKSASFGQEIVVPATIVECPPLKVFGIRAYSKKTMGIEALGDVTIEKPDKHLREKIVSFKHKHSKEKKEAQEKSAGLEWLDEAKNRVVDVRMLVSCQPAMTSFGKKKPDVFEVFLSGPIDQKIAFAKEKLGKDVFASEVFKEKDFIDVRAVDKGKGFSGVVKRFGVKIHRPKAKKHRYVGSIGPWNPSTVMWTVARPGQLGYQSRTELNKRIIMLGKETSKVNINGGFKKYGQLKNEFVVLAGSIPGPAKRAVSLRKGVRKNTNDSFNLSNVSVLGVLGQAAKAFDAEVKATKVVVEKEEKKEHKSVEEEIASAVKGK